MSRDVPDPDARFERWLLDAARGDTPPPGLAERAWERFATVSGHVAAHAAGAAPSSGPGPRSFSSSWTWLCAGLVAGSAITVAVLTSREAPTPESQTGPSRTAAPSESVAAAHDTTATHDTTAAHETAAARDTTAAHETATSAKPVDRDEPRAEAPRRRGRLASRRSLAPAASARRAHDSTLAAEVRALDAVRRDIETGHPERALAAVAAFHREFPSAQLAADAEGLAIEALLVQRDLDGAARRAQRFLRDYPDDPHASRFEPIAAGGTKGGESP